MKITLTIFATTLVAFVSIANAHAFQWSAVRCTTANDLSGREVCSTTSPYNQGASLQYQCAVYPGQKGFGTFIFNIPRDIAPSSVVAGHFLKGGGVGGSYQLKYRVDDRRHGTIEILAEAGGQWFTVTNVRANYHAWSDSLPHLYLFAREIMEVPALSTAYRSQGGVTQRLTLSMDGAQRAISKANSLCGHNVAKWDAKYPKYIVKAEKRYLKWEKFRAKKETKRAAKLAEDN